MLNNTSFNKWSKAHIFYDMFLQTRDKEDISNCDAQEVNWRNELLSSPNGNLLKDNSMFRTIQSKDSTFLLHATTKLEQILSNGAIYSSAGCLVGSVYSTVDGNKRTARILSNAILLANSYYPLSYRSVDEIEYKKALIIFYEQFNIYYFKKIFLEQYQFSVDNYFK